MTYGVLGLPLMAGVSLHFDVLSELEINGWTGCCAAPRGASEEARQLA